MAQRGQIKNPENVSMFTCYTGGPRFLREIGTKKFVSNITSLHLKKP
jgi:hypothetical protein